MLVGSLCFSNSINLPHPFRNSQCYFQIYFRRKANHVNVTGRTFGGTLFVIGPLCIGFNFSITFFEWELLDNPYRLFFVWFCDWAKFPFHISRLMVYFVPLFQRKYFKIYLKVHLGYIPHRGNRSHCPRNASHLYPAKFAIV